MTAIAMLGCFQSAQAEEKAAESLTDKALKHEKLGVEIESANHKFAEKYHSNTTLGNQPLNQQTVVVHYLQTHVM